MLKRLFPRSLFSRFILIIMIPTIMAQLIATFIFYHRHWSNVSNYMIDTLVGEIATVVKLKEQSYPSKVISGIKNDLGLFSAIDDDNGDEFVKKNVPESLQNLYYSLSRKLDFPINVDYSADENLIEIQIEMSKEVFNISTYRKKIENPTTYIFILWMTGTSAFFFVCSLIFSKNQIRPIIRLARVAEQFGRGGKIGFFKPEGALEVRRASVAFLKMKDRIEKQIFQRTEFLTGVSHDLRTPLTRIKLTLAMCDDEGVREIEDDVNEMERMITSYLDFARGEGTEESKIVQIHNVISSIVESYNKINKNIEYNFDKKVKILLKLQNFKRVLTNLLDNACKFGTIIKVTSYIEDENLIITIEDNGPGIEISLRERVFQPFYRIESSRNSETGGIGLGLSIVKDIIISHGGDIVLEDSALLGGLKVKILLPI